jgi:hypothetical protein
MAGEVEERATREGGDLALHEAYERKLDDIRKQLAQLPSAEARLARAREAYSEAAKTYNQLRSGRLRAGLGTAAVTNEERAAKRLLDGLEAELRLSKAEVEGLNRVGSPEWKDHTWNDMGNPSKRPCFPPGTPVKTPVGDRAIETLREGDLVYAFDMERGSVEPRRVLRVHGNWTERLVRVSVASEVISATRSHRFWLEDQRGWRPACELCPGDLLRDLDGPVRVASVDVARVVSPTVNLEIEGLHNFFVGRAGVLVHNEDGESVFASPAVHDSKFYRILGPLPNPPGGEGVVYVGKTWQDTVEDRFAQHMREKGWTSPPYEVVEIPNPLGRPMTAYETAVWEKHYIEQYRLENRAKGIAFPNNEGEPLWNDPKSDPINSDSYRDHRDRPFNRPCD